MSTTETKICCPKCGSTKIEIRINAYAIVDVSVVDAMKQYGELVQ